MPDNEPYVNNPDLKTPVPWGTRPEGPDWDKFAADRIAEHVAAGDRGAVLRAAHELEHGLGTWHPANPWRVIEHVAAHLDRALNRPDPEPPLPPAAAGAAIAGAISRPFVPGVPAEAEREATG